MVRSKLLKTSLVIVATVGLLSVCDAQQVYTTTPLVRSSDSYYESFGTDWGFSRRGPNGYMFFNRGGANTGIPSVGGYDPNAVGRFGFGSRGANGGFYFNAWAGQGSNRSITSTSPGLMLRNGGVGYVQDISVRPFVTGLIPVVGASVVGASVVGASVVGASVVGDRAVSPVEERLERLRQEAALTNPNSTPTDAELLLGASASHASSSATTSSSVSAPRNSSAERGDISLAEIRRQQASRPAAEPTDEINQLIETARLAEASGRFGAARIRYQQAAAKASGELKRALLAKCESLSE